MVSEAVEVSSKVAVRRMSNPIKFPIWVPTGPHRALHKAIRELNAVVYAIIEERKGNFEGKTDLLSRMLKLNLKENEIRDEVMTLLLAGHETTANALSWSLYLLGRHPEVQGRLREELRAGISGDIPTFAEVGNLKYCRWVFEEGMRLFPPAALVGRTGIDADEVGGYPLKPGAQMQLCQWVVHRHPAFWDRPNEFMPERFANSADRHPYAYFPFAAGPRNCVGSNLAMLEGVAILATIVKNFEFSQIPGRETKPLPLITVRPDPGVFLKVSEA
jgi:cytochrome P450